jgi:hypothetical protein
MTYADRLIRWNRWYDSTPEDWHPHIVLWPLAFAGFINMQLSIASGFPFGVLVLLGLLVIASIRLPYKRGWIVPPPEAAGDVGATFNFGRADWVYEINQRYEAVPEDRRFFVIPAILIVAGTLNLILTAARGWAFGGLFLLALLAVLLIRLPFVWGMLLPPEKVTESPLTRAWIHDANRWYDELPGERRFWTSVAAMGVVCVIDLLLVGSVGIPLALIFALELLALVVLRAPYVTGMVESPTRRLAPRTSALLTANVVPPVSFTHETAHAEATVDA